MLLKAGGVIMTITKLKSQPPVVANAAAGARVLNGLISAGISYSVVS